MIQRLDHDYCIYEYGTNRRRPQLHTGLDTIRRYGYGDRMGQMMDVWTRLYVLMRIQTNHAVLRCVRLRSV
jgi:hypothetical protein